MCIVTHRARRVKKFGRCGGSSNSRLRRSKGNQVAAGDGNLSRGIADVLDCNVSACKYTRVMYRCGDEMGISKRVSRHFVKDCALPEPNNAAYAASPFTIGKSPQVIGIRALSPRRRRCPAPAHLLFNVFLIPAVDLDLPIDSRIGLRCGAETK